MGVPILYRVPYEVRVNAGDLSSSKAVSNVYYLACDVAAAPPPYGTAIAGASNTSTLLAAFVTKYETEIVSLLSEKYKVTGYVMRSILGWKYAKVTYPITAIGVGIPTSIVSPYILGWPTGSLVSITGVTGAVAANTVAIATTTSPTTFTVPVNTTGQVWTGGGAFQLAAGRKAWIYGDLTEQASSTVGGKTGDALALFAGASVRRLTNTPGKAFRGRNHFSPIAEQSVTDGRFENAEQIVWASALAVMTAGPYANGGSEVPGSGNSFLCNISRSIAFALPTPFAEASSFRRFVTSMKLRPNNGSMLRRKPKLGAIIS